MANELQFVAIAAFLIWCLVCSLCGLFNSDVDEARLVWRELGFAGWSRWREVHFGLTAVDRRVLNQEKVVIDAAAEASLLDTVLLQELCPDSDAVQFMVLHTPREPRVGLTRVVYVSDVKPIASATALRGTDP